MADEAVEKLRQMLDDSGNVVFFGGAGVSTESGIPDFRSKDGLYSQSYSYPPEQILSHSFYARHKDEFFRFYKEKVLFEGARPNPAHRYLARLEKAGKLKAVITQNIDGLHQAAGSQNVIELHGSIHRNHCTSCGKSYTVEQVKASVGPPTCTCGGNIKPGVVLYEESLSQENLEKAVSAIQKSDMLIVGGTSLVVYPAAGLIDHYQGDKLVVINNTPTHKDKRASLLIARPIGQVFQVLDEAAPAVPV